ncbi:MAG: S8 family serine peptidase [Thiohalocapsa sp. PB-PSB1]|jgi:subtilisin family serine protease|nr:MAG: S8 family serine peptidase [Thiohalocapsa sp. PB-PSB1]
MKIQSTKVVVRVVDLDNQPVDSAEVKIGSVVGESLGGGRYELNGVPAGEVFVEVSDPSYEMRNVSADVSKKRKVNVIVGERGLPIMPRGGQEIPFRSPKDKLAVVTKGPKGAAALDSWAQQNGIEVDRPYGPGFAIITVPADHRQFDPAQLVSMDGVVHVGPLVNPRPDSVSMLTRKVIIRTVPGTTEKEVKQIAKDTGCKVLRKLSLANMWVLEVSDIADSYASLAAAKALSQNKNIVSAEPSLAGAGVADTITPTDELFGDQWHFQRVRVPVAWQHLRDANPAGVNSGDPGDLTYGSADLVIGVVDTGVKTETDAGVTTPAHPEFQGNVSSGDPKAIIFFDFENMVANNDNPNAVHGDGYHGSGCAGIITARAENPSGVAGEEEGVAGVAPNCRMVSALGSSGQTEDELSDIYLWLAGLDPASTDPDFPDPLPTPAAVITNSFGGHLPNIWPISDLIDQTLIEITDNGRGGLGCLTFWSTGNGSSDDFWTMRPYASHERTIGVGAVTDADVKAGYSNWGDGIDLCAPSSGGTDDIMTTTIPGDGDTAGHTGGGDDYISWFGGTSAATPLAAGVGALVLSMDPTLTWAEAREILIRTAERIDTGNSDPDGQWRDDDGDGYDEYSWWYGFGMVDAERAVCVARNTIEVHPSVAFVDVPEEETAIRPVTIRVHGWRPREFEIVNGPTTTTGPADSFQIHGSDSANWGGSFECIDETLHIWLKYTGTNDGDTVTGSITIRCAETGEEFPVVISANTIARPSAALVLALDRSGSMDDPAGDGRVKIELVRDGAAVVPVLVRDSETGLGGVRWATDADLAGAMEVEQAGEEVIGLGRQNLSSFIMNHTTDPFGMTAIGDAVEAAQSLLDDADGYDIKAMVVLTDGNETASKYISELSGADLHSRIYAIGVGTPENLDPIALDTLAGSHGGYMVLTGETTVDDRFLLIKYYQQILAGITNTEIVVDPQGWLPPGVEVTHQFPVNETDREIDVIVHTQYPSVLDLSVKTPDGKVIRRWDVNGLDSKYVVGHGTTYFRLALPSSLFDPQDPTQPWTASLKIDSENWYRLIKELRLKEDKQEASASSAGAMVHGLHYAFTTQARSSLRMETQVTQASRKPGAEATIRTKLLEYGYPLESNARVVCRIMAPDRTETALELDYLAQGVYEGSFKASMTGSWRVTVLAKGSTSLGSPFSREAIRTVNVWPGGDKPAPEKPAENTLEELLECICKGEMIDPEVARKYGIDLKKLCECIFRNDRKKNQTPLLPEKDRTKVIATITKALEKLA